MYIYMYIRSHFGSSYFVSSDAFAVLLTPLPVQTHSHGRRHESEEEGRDEEGREEESQEAGARAVAAAAAAVAAAAAAARCRAQGASERAEAAASAARAVAAAAVPAAAAPAAAPAVAGPPADLSSSAAELRLRRGRLQQLSAARSRALAWCACNLYS